MKTGAVIGLVIGVVLVLVVLFFVLTNNKGDVSNPANSQEGVDSNQMVDCGVMENPGCFLSRMNECLPVTGWFMSGENKIVMTVLGIENNTCHFQRDINNVIDMNCYFPEGTMNSDILAQTLGDDKGLQSLVDESCTQGL